VEWIASTRASGRNAAFRYGRYSITNYGPGPRQFTYVATHFAFATRADRWPADGLFVLHKCDNPLCVNPEHLFEGTQKENIADMIGKGRRGKPFPGSRSRG
jgi:hypothetical protein